MGPELIIAVLGPVVGGAISIFVWTSKKNYEFMDNGFRQVNTTVNVIERKLDDLRYDVAKNYVTNETLLQHIEGEQEWHRDMKDTINTMSEKLQNVCDKDRDAQ